MKNYLEELSLFLYKRYGVTPNALTYLRIFAAPWLALLISRIILTQGLGLAWFAILLYLLVIATDLLDGILARKISEEGPHDHFQGGMLDRLADKIFIVFMLLPFGLNLFTVLIILGESLLAFQAIHSTGRRKQAGRTGKIKMLLQVFLIPLLILREAGNFVPEMFVYTFIIITISATWLSVYSHYFDSSDE